MKSLKLLGFSLFFLFGCTCNKLTIQNLYITYEDLASTRIGTPDARKMCPDIGQRLLICWSLTKEVMQSDEIFLRLQVRFGDQEEKEILRKITNPKGTLIYDLLNDEYTSHCGILAYRAEIIADDCVIEDWIHQVWTERISFKD